MAKEPKNRKRRFGGKTGLYHGPLNLSALAIQNKQVNLAEMLAVRQREAEQWWFRNPSLPEQVDGIRERPAGSEGDANGDDSGN